MIYRIFNSFFMGIAFVSLIDFLYFIGIKLNYFDFYKITEYFNIIFIDNQNFYFIIPSFFIVGYLVLYCRFSKIFIRIYILTIVLAFASIYEPVGHYFGKLEFMKENLSFQVGAIKFKGDLLYVGRRYIYIYRKDILKTVKILKKDLKQQ
ncbi:MAG: isoleucyl-tRNA synthetase [Sulfurospirillum sp.]